jgi:protein-S-isoprenylcysteine O-methyltransferase Ste14
MPSVKSIVLVGAQLATMGGILATSPWIARQSGWLALEVAGCALGAWAVLAMRIGNFGIFPEFREGHRLVTRGPYRWIRHPMYTAVLIAFSSLVADHFSWLRVAIWIAMAVVHIAKLTFEEKLLRSRFADYEAYSQRTKRLIPFVW